jgi:MFS family permease
LSAALRQSFASLAVPNYRLYFSGMLASLAGSWMQIVAELWLILELTGSGVAVGVATALQFTGLLLFGAWGGALADRFDKRRLLMLTQAALALPALALLALWAGGLVTVPLVLGLIAVRGMAMAVDIPLRQAFVIEIVGRDRVVNAVSLNSVLVQGARIVGPALAGIIIVFFGVGPVFAINAATFGVMVLMLARMDPTRLGSAATPRTGPAIGSSAEGSRGSGVREALRYVRRTPELRGPLALMAVLGTFGFNFHVVLPLLARFSFGGEIAQYSALLVAMGLGAITGALVYGASGRTGPRVVGTAALGFGAAAVLAALAPTLQLEMIALALLGAAAVVFAAAISSGLQLDSAPEMRGRVMGLYSVVFVGTTPIGGPLAGWLGGAISPRASLLLAGAAGVVVAVAAAYLSRRGSSWAERAAGCRHREKDSPTGELSAVAG